MKVGPLPMSGADDSLFLPLRPLAGNGVEQRRYLHIDDSQRMYEAFLGKLAHPAELVTSRGHVVVVTGDRGCGKTSLIQRCACWLRDQTNDTLEPVIVDLTDRQWEDDSSPVRLSRSFNRVVSELGPYLSQEDVTRLSSMAGDVDEAYEFLSHRLAAGRAEAGGQVRPLAIVVLLPCYSTVDEVVRYCALAGPGMVFFAEIFNPGDAVACAGRLNSRPTARRDVHYLSVGKLRAGDARLVIEEIRRTEDIVADIPDDVLDEYFERPITAYGLSVLEMSKLVYGVLRSAHVESAPHVTASHVARYYQEQAYLPPDLLDGS
jgi:energy-coupling factor transporter ATP-binding protein EcfA2